MITTRDQVLGPNGSLSLGVRFRTRPSFNAGPPGSEDVQVDRGCDRQWGRMAGKVTRCRHHLGAAHRPKATVSPADRLLPLLAGIAELGHWLHQWWADERPGPLARQPNSSAT